MNSIARNRYAGLLSSMIGLLVGFCAGAQATLVSVPTPEAPTVQAGIDCPAIQPGEWRPYAHRYAIVVMGGSVSGQMYKWYWNDTSGKVWTLMDWGFAPGDIYYLSYGDSADAHPELADGISTKVNVEAVFDSVAARATEEDLVHIWWIDHGNTSGFEVHGGFVYFTELRSWIDDIRCRALIGAYNPCYSGAIMPHMAGLCDSTRRVITATSVNAAQGNSYGWAGQWRFALRGGRPDSYVPAYADANGDGYIAIDEAYEWETPHSNANNEYPLLDDNCDGVGGDLTNPATYDPTGQDSTKDGFYSQFYSLMGWYDRTAGFREDLASGDPQGAEPVRGDQPVDVAIAWTVGAALPSPVCRGASALIDGKIYLFGGHPSPAPVHYVYDIATDTWSTEVAPLPTPGSLTRGVAHGGDLYVFGGHTLGSDTLRCYHPPTNSWEIVSSPYPTGWRECCKYGAASQGDTIHFYYVEGRYSYLPQQSSWRYDVPGDSWAQASTPPSPKRMYFVSASDGEHCYAVGGVAHDESLTVLADAIRYSPTTGAWEAIDPLPEPVAFADGDFVGDTLFVVGGGAGYEPWPASDQVYCWSDDAGWLRATPLPEPVGCPHVEVGTIGGQDYVFVFGGYNGGYLNTLYIGELWPAAIDDEAFASSGKLRLLRSCPNPFNPVTQITFEVPARCDVRLEVFDVAGRRAAVLVDGPRGPGVSTVSWDGSGRASGVYFVRLSAAGEAATRSMVLLK